ncbi:MAG: 4'-phosphopantetheinyl transferase superfamily protein [Rhodanobacteraceae bacterium]|nr:4'-phosphopantetheinyl transferase superfamily protein [Rhodanobacteraceae bacterium]
MPGAPIFPDGFPAGVFFAAQAIDAPDLQALAGAAGIVPLDEVYPLPRRREFLAGRLAAQAALAQIAERGLVGRRGHAPVWPDGCCGSISHANGVAVAVAGSARDWRALGVDLEPAPPDDVVPTLRRAFAPGEWQACQASPDPWVWARAWAAKEAAWKCASALGPAPRLHELVAAWDSPARGNLALVSATGAAVLQLHASEWQDMALVLAALPAR